MKKLICLFLCACLICTVLPAGVLAAETTATETMLFVDGFDGYEAGESIVGKADTYGEWSQVVASAVSPIRAYEDATQGMVACYSHIGTTSGGPRLHKTFYFDENPTNITAVYQYRVENTDLSFRVYFSDGTYKTLYTGTSTTWEHVRVEMDFTAGSYTVYVGGVSKSTGKFSTQDYTYLDFRFNVGVAPEKAAYLDNVKFKTTDAVDAKRVSDGSVGIRTPEEIMVPFAGYPAAPALTVPTGKYAMFTYDGALNTHNGISTGTEVLWTKVSLAKAATLENEPLIRLTNDKRVVQYGYLTKKLAVGENPGNVCMEYYTVLADGGIYVTLTAGSKSLVNTNGTLITASTPGAVAGGWNKIKAVFDFTNQNCNVYVNDTLAVQNLAFSTAVPTGTYEVTLGVYAKLAAAGTVLVDNFVMYQDAEPVIEGVKYYGVTGTNWPLVTADVVLTQDSYVNNLRQHPRLYINDVQAVKTKINNDPQVKAWYTSYKKTADTCISDKDTGPYQYVFENGRNLKGVAGDIEGRLRALGFAYLVEGNEAYVERGLEEIYNLGTFPDWSNTSPILSSGITNGVACFYDWCYNSPLMTDTVKAEIIRIVKAKSLWQFVRSYDGVISVEIAEGTSNRTTVANACGAAMAIAMADEEPALAQKLIDGAVKHVKQTVEAYSPDGAFAEGTSYWSYANSHMFDFLIEMDVAVTEDYTKPEALAWYYTDARLVNTPLYWAYMYGPGGNFDFGDSSKGFSKTAQLFWVSQTRNQPFYGWFIERTLQRLGSSLSSDKAILYFDPSFEYYNDGSMPLDKTFNASDLAQVASMRSSWTAKNALFAAIQGGDNSASHMSTSLGTFVLDANGKRFVKQIGHVDYAAIYPSSMYYLKRAEGNNTIIANPGEEMDQNTNAIARFIAHGEAENEAFTVLDMTETNGVFTDAKRGMFMTKGRGSVVLQDEIKTETPSELWWFAHTDANITLTDGGKGAIMNVGGEKLYARITAGPANAVFTVMEPELLLPEIEAPDADAMQVITGKKLAIHMLNASDITLAVEFIPLRAGEGLPTSFTAVKPIADWSVSDNTIAAKRRAGDALVMLSGSPSVLAFEEKFAWDAKDASVTPYEEGGVLYVPAERAAELIYAKVSTTASSISLTRNAVTNTITEGIVTKDGVLYVPATALAGALGMQLRKEDNGLYVFADKLPTYTAEAKQAVYNELNTTVFVNGRFFDAFSTEKTEYYIPFDEVMPPVRVSSGEAVTKTKEQASFALNGTTYTFHRVDVNDEVSKYNTVLGKLVSADKTMGTSYIPAYMTDGELSTSAAVKQTTEQNVTFTFELDAPHRMKEFVIADRRFAEGSVMEKLVYSVRLEDGTWVEAGSIDNLDAVWVSGERRTNTVACTVEEPVTAIKIYMENTDAYINRIHVYEFEAYGVEITEAVLTPETKTTYELQGDAYAFNTEITASPESAYLVCVLYNGTKQVGMKLVPITGQEDVSFTMNKVDFDSAKVFLIESFINMHILTTPEIL